MALHNPHIRRGSRFPLCLTTFLSLLLFSFFVSAQETEPVDVISVRTDLVVVSVTVTDSRGRRISNLKQQDFILRDDGRNTRIDYFASGADRIALAFVLGNSGSLGYEPSREREAAPALLSHVGP